MFVLFGAVARVGEYARTFILSLDYVRLVLEPSGKRGACRVSSISLSLISAANQIAALTDKNVDAPIAKQET